MKDTVRRLSAYALWTLGGWIEMAGNKIIPSSTWVHTLPSDRQWWQIHISFLATPEQADEVFVDAAMAAQDGLGGHDEDLFVTMEPTTLEEIVGAQPE